MDQNDQHKVLAAGFLIIRTRDIQPINAAEKKVQSMIVCKTLKNRNWHTLERDFPSMAARDRRMKELLESETVIVD